MRRRLTLRLAAAALCLALSGLSSAAASADDAASALAMLRRAYTSISGLTAAFVQTEERPAVGVSHRDEGKLFFSPPDRMRWDYAGDDPHKVVIDGALVWMYTPSRRQAVRRVMTPEEMRHGPATFLSGLDGIEEDFRVQSRPGDPFSLELFPVSDATSFDQVSLSIDPATGLVERIAIHHKLGNITTITFHDLDPGTVIPGKAYAWDIPDGTEVVEP